MKSFLTNRFFLATIAFAAGATSVWGTTNFFAAKKNPPSLTTALDLHQDLRNSTDKILEDFFNENVKFQGPSENWVKNHFDSQLNVSAAYLNARPLSEEIKQIDDGEFKIFEIDLKDQVAKEVKVDVKDQRITISAEVEKEEKTDHSSQFYSSSFYRTFSIPPDVDGENYKMEQLEQKIVIKFPKKKV